MRGDGADQELRDRRRRGSGQVLHTVRLRRLRRLQGHRGRGLFARPAPRSPSSRSMSTSWPPRSGRPRNPTAISTRPGRSTPRTRRKCPARSAGSNLADSHELYVLGHFYEAAAAYYRGDREAQSPGHRPEERRFHRPNLRPGRKTAQARPRPRGDRDRPGQALPDDGQEEIPRPGQVLHRPAGERRRPQALRRIRPGPQARPRTDRSRRPCRPGGLSLFRDGRRRGPDRRQALHGRPRQDLGGRRHEEALPHGRHRRRGKLGGLRPGLRPAQCDRLRRDLRHDRLRPLELADVALPRRRQVYGPLRAGRLQRLPFRRRDERRPVLLSQPARLVRTAPADPLVRMRLLPAERRPVHRRARRLRLRCRGRQDLRESLWARNGEHSDEGREGRRWSRRPITRGRATSRSESRRKSRPA